MEGAIGCGERMSLPKTMGWIGSIWGVLGVCGTLITAIFRLSPVIAASLKMELTAFHYACYGASLVFFGYTEGYKAFQKQFSPRVVARALTLVHRPKPLRILLAPLFCMGFFGANKKRLIVSWVLAAGIIGLIKLVGITPQPWRGMIDLGVVVALGWGVAAILGFWFRALSGHPLPVPADLPDSETPIVR